MAGAQIKVVRIGQNNPRSQFVGELALVESLDGSLRAHGHEHGSFDGAVRGVQKPCASARMRAFGLDFKGDLAQLRF